MGTVRIVFGKKRTAAGKIAALAEPSDAEVAANKPKPIPEIYKKLRQAYDKYQATLSSAKVSRMSKSSKGCTAFRSVHAAKYPVTT